LRISLEELLLIISMSFEAKNTRMATRAIIETIPPGND